MTTLPLGVGAYKRLQANAAEIKLINRFFEKEPTNLKEKFALLSRPGASMLGAFLPSSGSGGIRSLRYANGLFNNDLFVVAGGSLFRYGSISGPNPGLTTHITGTINGSGTPWTAWSYGEVGTPGGYENMFISDGLLLQYYNGGTQATGTLTYDNSGTTSAVINIGGTHYGWNASVDTGPPNGSASFPWLCPPADPDPITALVNMLMFNGTPGTDFSTAIGGPNGQVTAVAGGGTPPLTAIITAISETTSGNSIATTVSGSHFSFGTTTLAGGGSHFLRGIDMPNGDPAGVAWDGNSYVMVTKAGTNKFYFINPGDTTIDPLDFMAKEDYPDPIVDALWCGDVALIFGTESQETWYATGDLNTPFAPLEGRTIARGCIPGTPVLVGDSVLYVGSDGIVYQALGSAYGSGSYGVTAMQRISDHGIEERVRMQLRTEAGLSA